MISNGEIYKALDDNSKKRIIMYLTARQFKNAVSIEEMIIIPTNGLPENTKLCLGNGLIKLTARGDRIISKHYPFLVNKAFACEVYLKFLLLEYNINFKDLKGKNGHNLLKLYEKVPLDFKKSLLKYVSSRGTLNNESLMIKLNSVSEVFTEWRYIYEKFDGISADFIFLDTFCNFLDESCRKEILKKYNYNVDLDIR